VGEPMGPAAAVERLAAAARVDGAPLIVTSDFHDLANWPNGLNRSS
jgi:hypothetical protein